MGKPHKYFRHNRFAYLVLALNGKQGVRDGISTSDGCDRRVPDVYRAEHDLLAAEMVYDRAKCRGDGPV